MNSFMYDCLYLQVSSNYQFGLAYYIDLSCNGRSAQLWVQSYFFQYVRVSNSTRSRMKLQVVLSKIMSASTEIVGNRQFDSKIICNGKVMVMVNKVQKGSPILFVAKDRLKQSQIISKVFLRAHGNFIQSLSSCWFDSCSLL